MESELFKTFAGYGGLVLTKTVLMSPLTSRFRLKNSVSFVFQTFRFTLFYYVLLIFLFLQTFANTEDLPLGTNPNIRLDDPEVERVRRAHQVSQNEFKIVFVTAVREVTKKVPLL